MSREADVPAVGCVVVSVAASSANLGPGFDCVGLALELRDTVEVRARHALDPSSPRTSVRVEGAGAGAVPTDARHLVAATVRAGLADLVPGMTALDLRLTCTNAIPHGQGLGSSATAVVAGLLAAWTLVHGDEHTGSEDGDTGHGGHGDDVARGARDRCEWLVDRSSAAEGHGDNAAASVLGGAVAAWSEGGRFRAVRLDLDPSLQLVTCVPGETLATEIARALLPAQVPHADAAFTGARTILLTEALRGRRDLLLAGTEDRLHQQQRAGAMPRSHALLVRLRAAGVAASVSGAGPALLCLGTDAETVRAVAGPGWTVTGRHPGAPARVEAVSAT